MKKLRNITLAALLLLTLNACANNKRPTATEQEPPAQQANDTFKNFGNENVTLQNGSVTSVNDLMPIDKITLIDCWASWCQPCRRAIQHLKNVAQTYANQLNIVSISCDKDYDSWTKALSEEQMPWTQAILIGDQAEAFMGKYNIQFIPFLIVVQDGNVVLTTNNPDDVDALLAELE